MTTARAAEPLSSDGGRRTRNRAGHDGRPHHPTPSTLVTGGILDERIAQLLAEAPPLTTEQLRRLRILLWPGAWARSALISNLR